MIWSTKTFDLRASYENALLVGAKIWPLEIAQARRSSWGAGCKWRACPIEITGPLVQLTDPLFRVARRRLPSCRFRKAKQMCVYIYIYLSLSLSLFLSPSLSLPLSLFAPLSLSLSLSLYISLYLSLSLSRSLSLSLSLSLSPSCSWSRVPLGAYSRIHVSWSALKQGSKPDRPRAASPEQSTEGLVHAHHLT